MSAFRQRNLAEDSSASIHISVSESESEWQTAEPVNVNVDACMKVYASFASCFAPSIDALSSAATFKRAVTTSTPQQGD